MRGSDKGRAALQPGPRWAKQRENFPTPAAPPRNVSVQEKPRPLFRGGGIGGGLMLGRSTRSPKAQRLCDDSLGSGGPGTSLWVSWEVSLQPLTWPPQGTTSRNWDGTKDNRERGWY